MAKYGKYVILKCLKFIITNGLYILSLISEELEDSILVLGEDDNDVITYSTHVKLPRGI